ncbi:MAG: DUF2339 domain-containing protein [Bacteroidota bacterium]
MAEDKNKIEELSAKLDELLTMHNAVSKEIDNLRFEIIRLKTAGQHSEEVISEETPSVKESEAVIKMDEEPTKVENQSQISATQSEPNDPLAAYYAAKKRRQGKQREESNQTKTFDFEKLIGENLINKIGILVLLIGVAIGAKYSIDNELISPLGRIVIGYVVGIILMGLGMWLKKKYLNFSAVLVSGAMAIFYFITFFAFSFYDLIGQEVAFGLMVLFTLFTVLAALQYDKEIIAHLGLVGAICIPFLLSDNSGNILFLFSYLALVNSGIAFISLRKNWKILFYSAFVLTWLIYIVWIAFDYDKSQHFALAWWFLSLFFALFYIIFISYKFLNLKKYGIGDVAVLLINALLFFALGYNLLYDHAIGGEILGVFAIGNAFIHFIAATIINRRKLADRNIFYLIVGLVLICLTLAIPIQLDGHWVTIMWSLEAVVLFLIGRSKNVSFYEYMSYAVLSIAILSLIQDWNDGYYSLQSIRFIEDLSEIQLTPFLNTHFLTSIIACISLGAINWIHGKPEWRSQSTLKKGILEILDYAFPVVLILSAYFTFRLEILHYFSEQYVRTAISDDGSNAIFSRIFNDTLRHCATIWLLNFTLLYTGLVSIILYKKINSQKATWAMIIINALVILSFLAGGLLNLSEMRYDYLHQIGEEHFALDNSFLWVRYVSMILLALVVVSTKLLLTKIKKGYWIRIGSEVMLYLVVLWVSTSELIHWLDLAEQRKIYGLALSIFWGIFSVIVISIGIWKRKKHLRILGIALFAITLVKLFFYDLSHLTTIAKTIVMISLGALLLLTSFLYNKYKIEDNEGA